MPAGVQPSCQSVDYQQVRQTIKQVTPTLPVHLKPLQEESPQLTLIYMQILLYNFKEIGVWPSSVFLKYLLQETLQKTSAHSPPHQLEPFTITQAHPLPTSLAATILNVPQDRKPLPLPDNSLRSAKESVSYSNPNSLTFYYDNKRYTLENSMVQKNNLSLPEISAKVSTNVMLEDIQMRNTLKTKQRLNQYNLSKSKTSLFYRFNKEQEYSDQETTPRECNISKHLLARTYLTINWNSKRTPPPISCDRPKLLLQESAYKSFDDVEQQVIREEDQEDFDELPDISSRQTMMLTTRQFRQLSSRRHHHSTGPMSRTKPDPPIKEVLGKQLETDIKKLKRQHIKKQRRELVAKKKESRKPILQIQEQKMHKQDTKKVIPSPIAEVDPKPDQRSALSLAAFESSDEEQEKKPPCVILRKTFADEEVVSSVGVKNLKMDFVPPVRERKKKKKKKKRGEKEEVKIEEEEQEEEERDGQEDKEKKMFSSKSKSWIGYEIEIEKSNSVSQEQNLPSQNYLYTSRQSTIRIPLIPTEEPIQSREEDDPKKEKKLSRSISRKITFKQGVQVQEGQSNLDQKSQKQKQSQPDTPLSTLSRRGYKTWKPTIHPYQEFDCQEERISFIADLLAQKRAAIIQSLFYPDDRITNIPTLLQSPQNQDFQLQNKALLDKYELEDAILVTGNDLVSHTLFSREMSHLELKVRGPMHIHFMRALQILLQKNPAFIIRLFQKKILQDELQCIWLCVGGEWRPIFVDEQIVTTSTHHVLMITCGNSLWPAILEKAIRASLGTRAFEDIQLYEFLEMMTGSPALVFKIRQNPLRNVMAFKYCELNIAKNYTILAQPHKMQDLTKRGSFFLLNGIRKEQNKRVFNVAYEGQEKEIAESDLCTQIQLLIGLELRLSFFMTSILASVSPNNTDILTLDFTENTRATLTLRPFRGQALQSSKSWYKFEKAGVTMSDFGQEKTSPQMKMMLYHEVEKDCLRLVGEKKSKKEKSFFECTFQPGRYYLFVTDISPESKQLRTFAHLQQQNNIPFCLAYYGEEKCNIQPVEQVDKRRLLNEKNEYVSADRLNAAHRSILPKSTQRFLHSLQQHKHNNVVKEFTEPRT